MSWDNWVILYRAVENIASFSCIGIAVLCIFLFKKLDNPFKVLAVSFWFSGVTEAIAWFFYFNGIESSYYNTLNHIAMFIDSVLMGAFFAMLVKTKTRERIIIFFVLVVIGHNLFTIVSDSISATTKYNGASLSVFFCLAGLVSLYDLSTKQTNRNLIKQPEVIVIGSYIIIYALLVLFFFLLPLLSAYSGLLATQMVIAKNLLNFFSLLGIGYGIWLKSKQINHSKLKPTAR